MGLLPTMYATRLFPRTALELGGNTASSIRGSVLGHRQIREVVDEACCCSGKLLVVGSCTNTKPSSVTSCLWVYSQHGSIICPEGA